MKLAYAKYSEITNLTLFFIYIENIFKKVCPILGEKLRIIKKMFVLSFRTFYLTNL